MLCWNMPASTNPSYCKQHILDSMTLTRSDKKGKIINGNLSACLDCSSLEPAVLPISGSKQNCPGQKPELGILQPGRSPQLGHLDTLLTTLFPKFHIPYVASMGPWPCIPLTSLRRPPTTQADTSQATSSWAELFYPTSSGCGMESSLPYSEGC